MAARRSADVPTPFSRVPLPWLEEWSHASVSATMLSVMALLISRIEQDGQGRFYAWYPRNAMAETLGVSERTVSRAINALGKRGFIRIKEQASRGRVAVYWIMPNAEKVPATAAPNQGERYRCRSRKGTTHSGTPKNKEVGGQGLRPPAFTNKVGFFD